MGEVSDTLLRFLGKLKDLNPDVKVLLTVSPVSPIATYEDRHILVSAVYTKSVLRVAAGQVTDTFDWVDYFPSYEIAVASATGGLYFEPDHRGLNPQGVAHVMRCFLRNFTTADGSPPDRNPIPGTAGQSNPDTQFEIVCDEEAINGA